MISEKIIGYKRLIAWQVADKLAWEVYLFTNKFPKSEIFGITSQLRRAVLSIVLNIVEGYARDSRKEFKHFLRIFLGSLAETDYLLEFSLKLSYITKGQYEKVEKLKEECGKVLWTLMKVQ